MEDLVKFLNSNVGTALIGFLGVIIGTIISYFFNKYYQRELMKSKIKEEILNDLMLITNDAIKKLVNFNSISNNISIAAIEYNKKDKSSVNNRQELNYAFIDYYNRYKEFQTAIAEIIMHLENHQIILYEFVNYYSKLMEKAVVFIDKCNDIRNLYENNIFISLHKINTGDKNIKDLIELENDNIKIVKEISYYLQTLLIDVQNKSYSKLFGNIKIESMKNDNYEIVQLEKKKSKKVNFIYEEKLESKGELEQKEKQN